MTMPETYCPECFAMIPADAPVCPACGADVVRLSARDYREKLLHALQHPLADVRLRAIIALGLRGDAGAADAMAHCALRYPADVTAALEVINGLRQFDSGPRSGAALTLLAEQHPGRAVRAAAQRALEEVALENRYR